MNWGPGELQFPHLGIYTLTPDGTVPAHNFQKYILNLALGHFQNPESIFLLTKPNPAKSFVKINPHDFLLTDKSVQHHYQLSISNQYKFLNSKNQPAYQGLNLMPWTGLLFHHDKALAEFQPIYPV